MFYIRRIKITIKKELEQLFNASKKNKLRNVVCFSYLIIVSMIAFDSSSSLAF